MTSLAKDRRAARELALDVLYQAEIRDQLPTEALSLQQDARFSVGQGDDDRLPSDVTVAYATELIRGVQEHAAEIDQVITGHAERWALDRMPVVDKNLLRVAVFELTWGKDVPSAVVINEAIELAKRFSTEDSGRFINGVLGKIAGATGVGPVIPPRPEEA